jgi:hypothetical protein
MSSSNSSSMSMSSSIALITGGGASGGSASGGGLRVSVATMLPEQVSGGGGFIGFTQTDDISCLINNTDIVLASKNSELEAVKAELNAIKMHAQGVIGSTMGDKAITYISNLSHQSFLELLVKFKPQSPGQSKEYYEGIISRYGHLLAEEVRLNNEIQDIFGDWSDLEQSVLSVKRTRDTGGGRIMRGGIADNFKIENEYLLALSVLKSEVLYWELIDYRTKVLYPKLEKDLNLKINNGEIEIPLGQIEIEPNFKASGENANKSVNEILSSLQHKFINVNYDTSVQKYYISGVKNVLSEQKIQELDQISELLANVIKSNMNSQPEPTRQNILSQDNRQSIRVGVGMGGSRKNQKTRKHKKIVKTKKNMKMRKGRKTKARRRK